MNDLALTGLEGTHPLGFLAACGLLRIVTEDLGEPARLWFDGHAWLRSSLDLPALIDGLGGYVARRRSGPELGEAPFAYDTLKDELDVWSERFRQHRAAWLAGDLGAERALDFLGGQVSDLATARDGETSKPTALDTTAGRQQFVRAWRDLVAALEGDAAPRKKAARARLPADLEEALVGPWRLRDDQHPMGWDPWAERLHAYQAVAPTADKRGMTSRAAVWLAFESLALFPVAAKALRYRVVLETTGFHRSGEGVRFHWPLWSPAATLGEVRFLVGAAEVPRAAGDPRAARALAARGVTAICRSTRGDSGDQGYTILRPPDVVALPPLGGTPIV